MSKGTKVTTVRIPTKLRAICEWYLAERAALATATPWTMTDLVTHALKEALLKRGRSGKGALAAQLAAQLRALELPSPEGRSE